MLYQISRNGKIIGTFNYQQVIDGLGNGLILSTDYYWTEGMSEWKTLEEFKINEPISPTTATSHHKTTQGSHINWARAPLVVLIPLGLLFLVYLLGSLINNFFDDAPPQRDIDYKKGVAYLKSGSPEEFQKGVNLILYSAKCGNFEARLKASQMYEDGEGVNRDLIESYAWLTILASANVRDYADYIENEDISHLSKVRQEFKIAMVISQVEAQNRQSGFTFVQIARGSLERPPFSNFTEEQISRGRQRADQIRKGIE